jgi:TadE-like protein
MTTRLQALTRADAGSAIAELLLVMPLLMLIFTGLVEAGRIGDYAIKLGNAAHAGAMYGAQNLYTAVDAAGIRSAALNDAQNMTNLDAEPSYFCICADGSSSQCQTGDCTASHRLMYVRVVTTGKVSSLTKSSFLPAVLQNLQIQRTAVMRVAQ